jgi:hypothetical protein
MAPLEKGSYNAFILTRIIHRRERGGRREKKEKELRKESKADCHVILASFGLSFFFSLQGLVFFSAFSAVNNLG